MSKTHLIERPGITACGLQFADVESYSVRMLGSVTCRICLKFVEIRLREARGKTPQVIRFYVRKKGSKGLKKVEFRARR